MKVIIPDEKKTWQIYKLRPKGDQWCYLIDSSTESAIETFKYVRSCEHSDVECKQVSNSLILKRAGDQTIKHTVYEWLLIYYGRHWMGDESEWEEAR